MYLLKRFTLILILTTFATTSLSAQGQGGDILNEAPLYKIPTEMTWEEYVDMNRRLTVGLVLSAIPIPGMIHFYAGEKKTGRKILRNAAIGVGAIILGGAMMEEGDFPETEFDHLILNPGDAELERQYMKIPIQIIGADTTFNLIELGRERSGAGGLLMLAGITILAVDIAYDYIHGIKTIEEKRAKVRYKYGKTLGLNLAPTMIMGGNGVGLKLSISL